MKDASNAKEVTNLSMEIVLLLISTVKLTTKNFRAASDALLAITANQAPAA